MAAKGKRSEAKSPSTNRALADKTGRIVRDRRFDRTQSALLDAFRTLLLQADYDALSVSDIIAEARIGRSTFYEHFQNKDDLLRESMRVVLIPLAEAATGLPSPQLLFVVRHFGDRSRLARKLLSDPTRRLIWEYLSKLIEQRLGDKAEGSLPRALYARQVAAGQLGLLEAWFNLKNVTAETVAAALTRR